MLEMLSNIWWTMVDNNWDFLFLPLFGVMIFGLLREIANLINKVIKKYGIDELLSNLICLDDTYDEYDEYDDEEDEE